MWSPKAEPWQRLGFAIIKRAYVDAVEGNGHSDEARCFLMGEGARLLAELLGVDGGYFCRLVENLPPPVQPFLPDL